MRPRPEKKYKEPRTPKRRRVSDIVYLMTILTAFETIGIAMLVFPRSTESITEKRELKKFPELSAESWFSGEFTEGISEWFSDTVPARDEVTNLSTQLRELRGLSGRHTAHNVGTVQSETSKPSTTVPEQPSAPDDRPASGVSSGESSAPQDTETSKPQTLPRLKPWKSPKSRSSTRTTQLPSPTTVSR
ncbi:MAG: DHHW family protein [Oscillospiraceae bacterium]